MKCRIENRHMDNIRQEISGRTDTRKIGWVMNALVKSISAVNHPVADAADPLSLLHRIEKDW